MQGTGLERQPQPLRGRRPGHCRTCVTNSKITSFGKAATSVRLHGDSHINLKQEGRALSGPERDAPRSLPSTTPARPQGAPPVGDDQAERRNQHMHSSQTATTEPFVDSSMSDHRVPCELDADDACRTISLSPCTPAMSIPNGVDQPSPSRLALRTSETVGTGSDRGRVTSTTGGRRPCATRPQRSGDCLPGARSRSRTLGAPAPVQTCPPVPAASLAGLTNRAASTPASGPTTTSRTVRLEYGTSTYAESLDGVEFVVGSTPPAFGDSGVRSVPGSSGCVARVPILGPRP